MTVRLILTERLCIERGDAEVVREPASFPPTEEGALLSSLQVPLPQGPSSLLSGNAPQRTETEPTKDWYDSAGRGLPSLMANFLLQLVRAQAQMKSRDLATIFARFSRSLQGRITPLLIYGARQKVVVPCSELYRTVASFSRSLQGRITPLLIYGARQKVVVPCSELYKTVASFSRSLQGRITPLLIYGARQKVVVPCSELYKTVASFSRSLQGRITPLLIYGARQKVVVPCSELYKTVASFSRSLQGRITPLLIYGARQKVVAASLLLIIIPTAIIGTISGLALGLIKARSNVTSSLRTGKQSVPLIVSVPPATIAPALSIASPANSHDNNKSQVTANVRAMRANPQPSAVHLNLGEPLKNKDTNSLTPNSPPGDEKGTLRTPLELKVVEAKPASNPPHPAIAVVVQIEEGRVKEAYIQNPQAGLRAFEATALRRARDRRYPKETSRKETVIVHISANQPSP